ncbi:hypothetical protein JR338_09735 [Chloroflexota bacterium]|nr:hypothetical protein JR338_09735 [Chloroflexota bacterium]
MRITDDLLHKFALDAIKTRSRTEPDLHAAYLIGSVPLDDALLGGAADIDIVLVHRYKIDVKREVEDITPEVSLDIHHVLKDAYEPHRKLRQDPWLGYPVTQPNILLHDTNHWFEFIQAGVSADFQSAENVLARSNLLLEAARENWLNLLKSTPASHALWLQQYLDILYLAANAVAGLIGSPLTTRRFLVKFREQALTLGAPAILADFIGLLGNLDATQDQLFDWTKAFEAELSEAADQPIPLDLAPCRHSYYLNAIRALTQGDAPEEAVWPLLKVWTDLNCLVTAKPSASWTELLNALQLNMEHLDPKAEALDAFLDNVELVLETWANAYV